MKVHTIDHPWMDEEFYKTGSYISSDAGASVIFCKGGVVGGSTGEEDLKDVTFIKKFFSEEYFVHVPREKLTLSLVEVRERIKSTVADVPALKTQANQDEVFQGDFTRLKKLIPGSLSKAVLLSREEYTSDDTTVLKKNIIARSFQLNHGRPYGFWSGNMGIVGCTPETLFEVVDGVINSEALAGTARIGFEKELLESVKDRREHEYVIRDISEKLTSLDLTVSLGKTETSPFSQIVHLKTPIRARMKKGLSILKLTSKLSPTAALGGYPADKAMNFLETMNYSKTFPDRIFGSVIGHISPSSSVGLVMIRNLQWLKETFIIESGVGVVEASELSKELSEIKLKREVVRNHFL